MAKQSVVIIGGGHNGLVAAATLAQKGHSVTVVEKNESLGGLCSGQEFAPGFTHQGIYHDTTTFSLEVAKKLRLEQHGLQWEEHWPEIVTVDKSGHAVGMQYDRASGVSEKDIRALQDLRRMLERFSPLVQKILSRPQPEILGGNFNLSVSKVMELLGPGLALRRMGRKDMLEFLRLFPMPLIDFLSDHVESPTLQGLLAAPSLQGTYLAPKSPGSATNFLLQECVGHTQVKGGPAALIKALESACESLGVTLRPATRVIRVITEQGEVRGLELEGGERLDASTVLASCDPKQLFHSLLSPTELGSMLNHRIEHFRARGTTAKLHFALKAQPELEARKAFCPWVRLPGEIMEIERCFDPIKYGTFGDKLALDVRFMTEGAPEGGCVASVMAHWVPFELKGGWTKEAHDRLTKVVTQQLNHYLPGFAHSVVTSETLTPEDLGSRFVLTGGHLHHGEHSLDQLITRPIPECFRYETPIRGLTLCGSGAHPGGGVTGRPGSLAAQSL